MLSDCGHHRKTSESRLMSSPLGEVAVVKLGGGGLGVLEFGAISHKLPQDKQECHQTSGPWSVPISSTKYGRGLA